MARLGGVRAFTRARTRTLFTIGVTATALGALVAGCGSQSASNAPAKQANGGYSFSVLESTPGFFDLPLRVAVDQFAPQHHLKLKILTVNGGGSLATEFEGGTGSVAMVGVDSPMRLAAQNSVDGGITIIGTNMTNMLYAVVAKAGSKYHSLADLAGVPVAVTGAGSASQTLYDWAMATKQHASSSQIKTVPLGSPPTILAGVQQGRVAAGTVFSPALDEGLADHSVQIVFDFRNYPYAQNVFMARTKEVEADSQPYKLFMQAYNQAVNKIESDPAFALSAAQKYWGQGTSPSILKSELDFYVNKEWKSTAFTQQLYDQSKAALLASGSGFSSQTFPTYEDVTEHAPKLG
ncbi:MAG TPA: ABC transporter substrate-binding protein [Pseudonocardiaceae bacterium]|jgi:ABC-type nitrate/sulfonate/bicarbonate transport system substrate-binding protein|nr:ABC transporter substrate-binding protein [Pseudonocardiaceae bacterium]